MLIIKMPNGDTPMQYPFPYKNTSGDTSSGGSPNLDPTFIATTTGTLLVTGNSTFQGIIDAEIIVGTLISGSNFTGQESKAGLSTTSQKNSSTSNAAYAGLEAINNNNGTVGLYSYGSLHATRPTSAWLETTNPLKIKGSSTSLFAGTNENLICSGTNVRVPFLTASRPVSTDGSFNLVSASVTGNGATVLQTSPTLITPSLGAATGTSLQLSGLTASLPLSTDASKNLVSASVTGTGSTVLQTSPTLITPSLGAATGTSLQLSGLTASQSVHTDASKNLVSVFNTGSGNNVMSASPTFTGTIQCAGINGSLNWTTTGTLAARTSLGLSGATSGTVTISCQSTAGTYNFNLPTTAGSSGDVLTSAGGGASAMIWTGSTGTGNLVRATGPTFTDILLDAGGGAGTFKILPSGNSTFIQSGLTTTTGSTAPLLFTSYNAAVTNLTIGTNGNLTARGTVSGTGYVGNSTGLASVGNIGEILGTGTISTIDNGFSYAQTSTTAPGLNNTWAVLVSITNVPAGLYTVAALGYTYTNQAGNSFETNIGTSSSVFAGTSFLGTSPLVNTFVSYSFTKIIRVTSTQTISLYGKCNSNPTLSFTQNSLVFTRIG